MHRFRAPWSKDKQSSTPPPPPSNKPPPPPIPSHSRPPPPPPPRPQPPLPTTTISPPTAHPPGAIYPPGKWPTPELSIYPLNTWLILSSPDKGWTSASIQAALDALGEGGTLYLPRSSKWDISEPILLRPWQELATEGYPTEEKDMAALEATPGCRPHLVNCWNVSGVRLRNLLIDGKHDVFGRDDKCGVMVQFGGPDPACHDQWCDRCIIRNPRQWSCFQAFEGTTNVRITNCRIGPAGIGKDIIEGHWADGISFAASHGLVAGNEITDATDGAIVVFQATGTLVTSNTIVCYSRLLLGGINMVDHAPGKGDYSHTRVVHNTILTAGGYIVTAIAQGPTAWGAGPGEPSEDKLNRNAIVARNLIHYQDRGRGKGAIGYGFAVSADVRGWTCVENVSDPGVVYSGDMSDGDWGLGGMSLAPGPFVRSAGPVEKLGVLQEEFVPGLLRGLLAVKPGRSPVLRLFPRQLSLRPGEKVQLKHWALEFRLDGDVQVRNEGGEIAWSAGLGGTIKGHEKTAVLELSANGHLWILPFPASPTPLLTLTPLLPDTGLPGCTPQAESLPSLQLSDTTPHLQLLTPSGGILLSSCYEVPWNTQFPVDTPVCQPSVNAESTLVAVLSPLGQYMILSSRRGRVVELPIKWPLEMGRWYILWQTRNAPLPQFTEGTLAFQGDGNLVLYAGGKALWNTATYGPPEKQARWMKWGDGGAGRPYLELVNEARERVWST
ncbi:hypothetical protein DACRYDRAFT_106616 [Dacryopinax primogenitus]|uniref:Bulb-type lectin domain-containing protein n=1 Tax=Dacryopinax primogenitus (strain DJM 731) TaxID=1858805 RepID=M5G2U3_DACPD|nr:uncharacterized protein DACRYDRAFT_106616 [Dacryopinax primogenitus]EJU02545.1 hypothetical protein DACRYDRAFT_106616 [Dacryopinax primogenitus]